jgi:hypothetical protein
VKWGEEDMSHSPVDGLANKKEARDIGAFSLFLFTYRK